MWIETSGQKRFQVRCTFTVVLVVPLEGMYSHRDTA